MEKSKIRLKALEALENTPIPPDIIPGSICTQEDQRIRVPSPVMEYLEKMNDAPELDSDGLVPLDVYMSTLRKHGMYNNGIPHVIRLVTVGETSR